MRPIGSGDRSALVAKLVPQAGVEGELPALRKGRLTSSHIVRWCAAQENWDKIHYDERFAREVARLPGTVINGALKQHLVVQFLANAFGRGAWIWRVDCRFTHPDLVGQELELRGRITDCHADVAHLFVAVELEIWNRDLDRATSSGRAVVVLGRHGAPALNAEDFNAPAYLRLDEELGRVDAAVPRRVRETVGEQIEALYSAVPVEISRLRLFADAVMGLDRVHFDADEASHSPYGEVVATPLFPLHAIKLAPDALPLSAEPRAFGREGVSEVGRNLAALFGLDPSGMLNGGNQVAVRSLARLGDYVGAVSRLVGARVRSSPASGEMLIVETLNRYFVVSDSRELLTERQTLIYRSPGLRDGLPTSRDGTVASPVESKGSHAH